MIKRRSRLPTAPLKRRMLFKIGVTLIILIGVFLFFMVEVDDNENRRDYRQIIVERTNELKMLMVRKSQFDKQPPWAVIKNQALELEDDINQEISNQIDQEEAEIAHYIKSQGEQPVTQGNVARELGDDEKEFYYDNNLMEEKSMYEDEEEENEDGRGELRFEQEDVKPKLHLSVVVCESRAKEALVMLKSAVLMTQDAFLVFHIVADSDRKHILEQELNSWPQDLKERTAYQIYDVIAPQGTVTLSSWNKLYKPCAAQRLFLPDRLKSIDSVIYVDTDTVFLRSVQNLWSYFSFFNSSQLVGLVREAEDGSAGWYNRFANHPYYGDFGVNSGVMLMNLTRIRKTDWLSVLQTDYEKYRLAITWGDQDLINIYFSKKPDQLYLIPCEWNYRADHCMYTSNCASAERHGVSLLHGSRGAFYSDKEPAFGAVHEAFSHFALGVSNAANLLSDMKGRLRAMTKSTNCGQVAQLFLTHPAQLASLASPPAKVKDSLVPNSIKDFGQGTSNSNKNVLVKNVGNSVYKNNPAASNVIKGSNSGPLSGKALAVKSELPRGKGEGIGVNLRRGKGEGVSVNLRRGKGEGVGVNSVNKHDDALRKAEVANALEREEVEVKEVKIVLMGEEVGKDDRNGKKEGMDPIGGGDGKKAVVLKDGFGSDEDMSDLEAQYEVDEDEEDEQA